MNTTRNHPTSVAAIAVTGAVALIVGALGYAAATITHVLGGSAPHPAVAALSAAPLVSVAGAAILIKGTPRSDR